ncbi:MAG: zinc ribbon domain-containing protein [Lachnospiraceae bacterium]|nr:zinc ribbon domain-containing protein [Lachnospiraceae bacterium]
MFFIFAISPKIKDIDFTQTVVCKSCGKYGRLNVFVRYMSFSIFFIPIIRWGKKYFVKSSCCGKIYSIDKEIGRAIEFGEIHELSETDLNETSGGGYESVCPSCGYPINEDFEYCPKCGKKLNY